MKFSSLIDNVTAQDWGLNIQLAYLFDWVYSLPSWATPLTIDGVTYYFASKTLAVKEMPLLTDKIDTMYRYYRQLEDKGLILLKKADGKDYVSLTSKAKQWNKKVGFKSEDSEMNPMEVGNESENCPEKNPTYKTTISDQTISDHEDATQNVTDFDERKEKFRKSIMEIGGLIYTRKMLDRFIGYWSEPNGAKKPKMKWEVQRDKLKNGGFQPSHRLSTWATQNLDNIVCYLTDEEKTVISKQFDFRNSLVPFIGKYPKEMLKSFFMYWTQVENKPGSNRMRWELEGFWELPFKLTQWADKNGVIPQRHENVAR